MKHILKRTALLLCAVMLAGMLAACGTSEDSASGGETVQPAETHRTSAALDLTDATSIILSGSGAAVDGKGAEAEGSVVTITAAGVYAVSGTLEDGRIIVNAPKEEVTIALNGADITCSYGSPLYIYKAGTATVYLAEGTENFLTDGAAYTFDDDYSSAADEEPNACLYSKADMIIEGTGKLTVTANFDNGITSKDTLQIYGCTISVSAVGNGINGKDSNTIEDASITVVCNGDAIRSTNDTDGTLGWISISNATLDLTAGEDGIQAETALTMSEGAYTIASGGGSGAQLSADASAKGIKAGTALALTGGTYSLDCADDAVHSNGDVTVSGGVYTISTGDDAFHADENLTITAGEIDILQSYEGLEGSAVTVSGGTVRVVSADDGVNAAGGADGSGFGGFDRGNPFGGGNSNYCIEISGGCLVVQSGGDGLDSNGNIVMSGGTVLVSSSGMGDGALDYDGSFTLTGGTLLAAGGGMMAQAPSEASQYTVSIGFTGNLPAGTYVSLAGEDKDFVFEIPVSTNNLVFSSPELEGGVYTVSYGGEYSGEAVDGICSGGSYSGGTVLTELTLSDLITTYGGMGMGGMGGRPGGNMGGGRKEGMGDMGDIPAGDWSELPGDGEFPGGRFDGEMSGNGGMPGEMPENGEMFGEIPGGRAGRGGQEGMPEGGGEGWGEPPAGFPDV